MRSETTKTSPQLRRAKMGGLHEPRGERCKKGAEACGLLAEEIQRGAVDDEDRAKGQRCGEKPGAPGDVSDAGAGEHPGSRKRFGEEPRQIKRKPVIGMEVRYETIGPGETFRGSRQVPLIGMEHQARVPGESPHTQQQGEQKDQQGDGAHHAQARLARGVCRCLSHAAAFSAPRQAGPPDGMAARRRSRRAG